MDVAKSYFASLTPSQYCQAFFVSGSALVLSLQVLPRDLRRAIQDYGARRPGFDPSGGKPAPKDGEKPAPKGLFRSSILALTNLGSVPHGWFLHFYVLSVSWSAFWIWQYITHGTVMSAMIKAQVEQEHGSASQPIGRVMIAWGLMAIQGVRRLYESLFVTRPGTAPMWFVHWLLGLAYYTAMGVSVWIEGSSEIVMIWEAPRPVSVFTSRVPSALALFFIASKRQNEFHANLASLKKYTLPTGGWFDYLICPHYFCECLIYVSIALVAAPPGRLFNTTVLYGLGFIVVNLGATAHSTKQWYAEKFGKQKVEGRWRMIPFVF